MARSRTGETFVQTGGQIFKLTAVEDDHGAGASDPAASGRLTATMPGRVIKVLVEPGQEVQKNQPVIIMESMKMEITQSAPFDGKVEEISVTDGQQIDAGAVLVRIEPISQAADA
jgi:pyruvate carboxylase